MADESAKIELLVFDLAGTTVDDSIEGIPLVAVAMKETFSKHGYGIDVEVVNKYRGMEKREAIQNILNELHRQSNTSPNVDVEVIFKDFKYFLNKNLSSIKNEIPGTTDVFRKLKSAGMKIAVGSGFPHSVVESIASALEWTELVDYLSSAEKAGHGRPHPAMILSAMKFFNISDPRAVIKVGDTKIDVQEGKNAGCWTVSVLTGTQTRDYIKGSNPDFIINSIADLPDLLSNEKFQLQM
ncbi:phosphonoacetaldehyde hydrolase-like [Oculina patagonica]